MLCDSILRNRTDVICINEYSIMNLMLMILFSNHALPFDMIVITQLIESFDV